MTFISGGFFVFIFCVFILYYRWPVKSRWIVLLLASCVFYLFYGWKQVPFLVLSSLLVYGSARWMDRIYRKAEDRINSAEDFPKEVKDQLRKRSKKKCRRILTFTVLILVGVLFYCKAALWVLQALQKAFSLEGTLSLQVIVPLGVSYYTFSMIGYLADVYWRKETAETNYFKFLLFVSYFPQILQGPIARHKKLAPQLTQQSHPFDYKEFCYGLQLALWGYFKKLVIADRLSIFVTEVFGNFTSYQGIIFVIAAMLASIQLYCDFSGCMDMAAGFSQALGIRIERNFNHPFFSKSAAEFWRRWHITLGAWFKDYVYMPIVISPGLNKFAQGVRKLFGKRAGKAVMTIIPLTVVWLLTGIWHGTGYNYIAWGIYWGAMIILSTVFSPEIKKLSGLLRIRTESRGWQIVQMVRTFLLFSFGRLITLPGSLSNTWDILKRIVSENNVWILFDGSLYNYGLNQKNFYLALLSIFVLWGVSMLQERGSVRDMIADNNVVIRWGVYYLAIFSVVIFGMYGAGFSNVAFTYMNY